MESERPPIWAKGLVRRYGSLVAVNGLDLVAERGTCLALLGPNGAGKTTTLEMLIGLTQPDEGTLKILGMEGASAWPAIREQIGVQLQETRLLDKLTVRETLTLFGAMYAKSTAPATIESRIGLTEKSHARVGTLSGGQRQRLTLGCALINEPKVLFLDEPSTGLDPQARRRVWEIVQGFKKQGGTVLLTTHFMQEAEELADHVVIIDHGQAIARGTPAELIHSLNAQSVLEFRIGGDGDTESVGGRILKALGPDAKTQTTTPPLFAAAVLDTQSALMNVLQAAAHEGASIEDLRIHRTTLEDVFIAMTGRQLRDS
ncbi:MAG TPA: ABC transporter ATP-binding protein [Planctomycetota bacterium]|nr:ABC transporter ATP-binding protein [Planctomycetota bacterium]